jgi:hypothetical protein
MGTKVGIGVVLAVPVLCFTLVACAGRENLSATPASAKTASGASSEPNTSALRAACDDATTHNGTLVRFSTLAEARAAMIGVWLLCSPTGLFGAPQGGVEFRANGELAFVPEDGTPARAAADGSWKVIDTSVMNGPGSFQLNSTNSAGTTFASLRMTDSGLLWIDANGVSTYSYLNASRLDGQSPPRPPDDALPALPAVSADAVRDGCQRSPGYRVAFTADDARDALSGVWLLCTPGGLFGEQQAGIELRTTGEFSLLRWSDAGALERLDGPRDVGSWEVIDTSIMNGPGAFQVDYRGVDGTVMGALAISNQGMLSINNNGVATYVYLNAASLF